MPRLIPVKMIPSSLWSKDILRLPPQLVSCWEMLLDKYHLRDRAMTEAPEGFEGGMSKEDTDNHLAWRFTGSSARVMLTMLDPKEDLQQIPDTFARIFSGNRVFLADLPCGSGAASISILSVFCELRKLGKIPRMPLHITIVGGEISEYAQTYARESLSTLINDLEDQAITIEFDIIDWDVCDKFSNTDLIQQLTLKSQNCSGKLLLLANFSGFLERIQKWKDAKEQFDELFRYSRGNNSIALWIEPEKNNVIKDGGFFSRLLQWFEKQFSKIIGKNQKIECSSVKVSHPLGKGEFRTNLAVIRFDLPLRSNKV
jgi:hypothetical protein